MLTITATCICSADTRTGVNKDNLLFSGQILPEVNGGLAGTPSTRLGADGSFLAAVLCGDSAAASYYAAVTLRDTAPDLRAPEAQLRSILHTLEAGEPPAYCAAAVVCAAEDKLALATAGDCLAYLLRDRSLFLLHDPTGDASPEPYTITGVPIAGDRLLLCSAAAVQTLDAQQLLSLLFAAHSDAQALQQLLQCSHSAGAQDSVTAMLLRFA